MFESILDIADAVLCVWMPVFFLQFSFGWAIIAINKGIVASVDDDLVKVVGLPNLTETHGWRNKAVLIVFPVVAIACSQAKRHKERSD
jgi:hypothetical protein